MNGFLTLWDVVLPPPLPAIVAILLVAGMAGISERIIFALDPAADFVRRAAAFVLVIGTTGVIVTLLCLAHLATFVVLKGIAGMLLVAGLLRLIPAARSLPTLGTKAHRLWNNYAAAERTAAVAIAVAIGGLFLAACGPVTDPDSLDYHLGVPLDWLRHSGRAVQPHWLHARLTGLGEAVNMLGLAAGTDCLGAILQTTGLIILLFLLAGVGRTPQDRVLGLLLALPPAVIPLATSQKPQLFPVAAVVVAMVVAITAASTSDFALLFGCLAFASACKYSFLASAGPVAIVALVRARRKEKLTSAVVWAAAATVVFLSPLLYRNIILYHDPVSPFLESLKSKPDPEVLQFARYLRDAGAAHSLRGIANFLSQILIPEGTGQLQTVLGMGVLAFLVAGSSDGSVTLLLAAGVTVAFTLWRGQLAPRYLLEPYYWCALAAVSASPTRLKSVLYYGLTAQTFGVAAMALFAAALLFPGALTPRLREEVMRRATFGYAQARWMDRVLPPDATVMVDSRAYALFPRPFLIPQCASCGGGALLDLAQRSDFGPGRASVIVPEYPPQSALPPGCQTAVLAGPEHFAYAVRSPFAAREYRAVALLLHCP